ncbi:hypothetical protein [Mycobacterium simiae]|uniref:hypothetical protein n=1 Tax=Mycobacterium simiae TaxID=1784 RepID=UPI00165FFC26|nr:hypothetical protein [Mycobacterium simiae]
MHVEDAVAGALAPEPLPATIARLPLASPPDWSPARAVLPPPATTAMLSTPVPPANTPLFTFGYDEGVAGTDDGGNVDDSSSL